MNLVGVVNDKELQMRCVSYIAFIAIAFNAPDRKIETPEGSDLALLQGSWVLVSYADREGTKTGNGGNAKWTIKGTELVRFDGEIESTFTINANEFPKVLTATTSIVGGPFIDVYYYEVTPTRLRIMFKEKVQSGEPVMAFEHLTVMTFNRSTNR